MFAARQEWEQANLKLLTAQGRQQTLQFDLTDALREFERITSKELIGRK